MSPLKDLALTTYKNLQKIKVQNKIFTTKLYKKKLGNFIVPSMIKLVVINVNGGESECF